MSLRLLGWSAFRDQAHPNLRKENIVRITAVHKNGYRAMGETTQMSCTLSGSLLYETTTSSLLPAVGDWCEISPPYLDEVGRPAAIVLKILDRQSKLSRLDSGEEQVLAANIDRVCIVTSANGDLNLKRLRRYLILARESMAAPLIVLSKCDLAARSEEVIESIQAEFPGVETVRTSILEEDGLELLRSCLTPGSTSVFVGSSGVGKSSLVNALLGKQHQEVKEIRADDDKGRHTTTSRELFVIPEGGVIIDTPGIRGVGVLGREESLGGLNTHIKEWAAQCKFADCRHDSEPGCAILQAITEDELLLEDWEEYRKLQREMKYANRKISSRKRFKGKSKKRTQSENRNRRSWRVPLNISSGEENL